MNKVCIIDTNDIMYTEHDNYHSKFTKEKIEDDIEDFISFKTFNNNEEFMNLIMETLNPIKESTIYSTIVYEDSKYVYQMSHIILFDEQFKEINNMIKTRKINRMANILCNNIYKVYSKVIITKSRINADSTLNYENMTMQDMIDIFRRKLVTCGVLIKCDNSLKEIEYIGHPLSWVDPHKGSNYRYYELEMIGKIFMFFIEIKPENNMHNKLANNLYRGKNPIYGDVFVITRNKSSDIRMTDNIYSDLWSDTITKLLKLLQYNEFSIDQEPSYYDMKNNTYHNLYTMVNKLYNTEMVDMKEEYKYDSISLNDITNELINKAT